MKNMGTRAQVKVISKEFVTPFYLYQHYDGYDLIKEVRNAIIRGEDRWNDPEYLTRIIFSEMIKDSIMNETGYGIGTSEIGDIEFLVTVNIDSQIVTEIEVNCEKLLGKQTFSEIITGK